MKAHILKDRVSIDLKDGVADVRLIRADKMNALDRAMFEGLIEAAETLTAMKGLRAVVLSGEGKAFCAGLDMGSFAAMKDRADGAGDTVPGARDLVARTHGIANQVQQSAWAWRALPVPVIAAVHGVALGGGFQVALGADMRYATPDSRFSVMEIKWGLVPDLAGTQLMRHLAREDVVRELTYTGRIFDGEEALRLGFVTRLMADPRTAALETAREIANKSPDAVRAAKRLLNAAVTSEPGAGLLAESQEQQKLIGAPNQLEAVMSNLQKRAATYRD
jgi:enoyl-CoA hydratase/carnithine racemase